MTASDAVKAISPLKTTLENTKPHLDPTPGDCAAFTVWLDKFMEGLPWLVTGILVGTLWTLLILALKSQP